MYRPQSQISRQRSTDIRDLQSKTKKLSNKQYKDYVKRLIQNTPNHIDSQRRLKIDSIQSNRNELRQRIEKKLGEEQKQMWRSGVVRFIKPILSQRQYRRFKKLFEIFSRIQKIKHQILSLTFSSTKYIKDSGHINSNSNNGLYQSERLKELKEHLLRMQLDQEKILLQIENQSKENNHYRFSMEKVNGNNNSKSNKNNQVLENNNKFSEMRQGRKQHKKSGIQQIQIIENESTIIGQSPNFHKRIQSQHTNNKRDTAYQSYYQTETNNQKYQQKQHKLLFQLREFINSLDHKKSISKGQQLKRRQCQINKQNEQQQKSFLEKNIQMAEQIKSFIGTKQKTIDQLFASLTSVNSINHSSSSSVNNKLGEQIESGSNTKYGSEQGNQTNNMFNKFHQIDRKAKQQQQQKNNTNLDNINNNNNENSHNNSNNNNNKKFKSFKSLLQQIEHDLTEYKQINSIKERNNQLAKILLTTNKDLQLYKEQNILLKQQFIQKNKLYEHNFNDLRKQNKHLKQTLDQKQKDISTKNKLLQQAQYKILQLETKIIKHQQYEKQNKNNQKYYRQVLTLQQQVKILSQQNQHLLHQLQVTKQQLQLQKQREKQLQEQTPSKIDLQKNISKTIQKTSSMEDEEMTVEKKQQNNNKNMQSNQKTHDKSIKSCSSTSLMYKQFERKNKKLTEENIKKTEENVKKTEQNKLLVERIKESQEKIRQSQEKMKQLQSLIDQMSVNLQVKSKEIEKLTQQNTFLQQQNTVLLQQNKKIQQQFQYLVKQKLQIESNLSQIQRQHTQLTLNMTKVKQSYRQKLSQMHELIIQLREDNNVLRTQVSQMGYGLKEVCVCLNEEITNALQIFVSGMAQGEEDKQLQQQCKQQRVNQNISNDNNNNSQQIKQQSITPTQQQYIIMQQQYQTLAVQYNHCLYQLNNYKDIFNQTLIEKELLKQYHQQDQKMYQIQIIKLEQQIIKIKSEKQEQIRLIKGQSIVQINQKTTAQTQTITYFQYTNIKIHSNVLHQYIQPLDKVSNKKLKINCESFSINLSQNPSQNNNNNLQQLSLKYQQSTQTECIQLKRQITLNSQMISICCCQNIQKNEQKSYQTDQQTVINFQSWIQQLQQQLEHIKDNDLFINFCRVNLSTDRTINQTIEGEIDKQNNKISTNFKQQHNQKSLQHQSSSSSSKKLQSNQPNCLYRNQSMATTNSVQQQGYQKLGIFGSLYNKFSFPKLQPIETKQELHKNKQELHKNKQELHKNKQELNKKVSSPNRRVDYLNNTGNYTNNNNNNLAMNSIKRQQIQLPLQGQPQNHHININTQFNNNNNNNNSHAVTNTQTHQQQFHNYQMNQFQTTCEEQDQSFDLCII